MICKDSPYTAKPKKPPKRVPVATGRVFPVNLDTRSEAIVRFVQAKHNAGSPSKLTRHAVIRRALELYGEHVSKLTDWDSESGELGRASARKSPTPDSPEAAAIAAAVASLDTEGAALPLADVLDPVPLRQASAAWVQDINSRVDASLNEMASRRGALANKLRAAGYGPGPKGGKK
ncbi:hypothetical protein [Piscinibacterium candidicorallinum]|uniref:Uncharacterized protein n=1 Tax=Piscinibacterium candidicorallinum TaxID=1793872 RepID=A0ABV7GZG9_9BURK